MSRTPVPKQAPTQQVKLAASAPPSTTTQASALTPAPVSPPAPRQETIKQQPAADTRPRPCTSSPTSPSKSTDRDVSHQPAAVHRPHPRNYQPPTSSGHLQSRQETNNEERDSQDQGEAEDGLHINRNRLIQPGRKLQILQWNIQGARTRMNLLHKAAMGEGVDVFLLQETLAPQERPVFLRGYTTFSIPRSRRVSQGTAILVRNTIPCTRVTDPAFCGEGVDVMAVTLTLRNTPLNVYNIYNPTRGHLHMEELLAQAALTPTYIGGDFNCHHPILDSPSASNTDGRHLARMLSEAPDVRLLNNGEATHLQGGVLDLSLISAPLAPVAEWSLHPTLTSDHFAVRCLLDVATLPAPLPPPPTLQH